jgi:hypothetical protein
MRNQKYTKDRHAHTQPHTHTHTHTHTHVRSWCRAIYVQSFAHMEPLTENLKRTLELQQLALTKEMMKAVAVCARGASCERKLQQRPAPRAPRRLSWTLAVGRISRSCATQVWKRCARTRRRAFGGHTHLNFCGGGWVCVCVGGGGEQALMSRWAPEEIARLETAEAAYVGDGACLRASVLACTQRAHVAARLSIWHLTRARRRRRAMARSAKDCCASAGRANAKYAASAALPGGASRAWPRAHALAFACVVCGRAFAGAGPMTCAATINAAALCAEAGGETEGPWRSREWCW